MNVIVTDWNWGGELTLRSRTDYIVLHHAAARSCTAEQVDKWHKDNGWIGIGYHYFVRKNGTVYRGRSENTVGAHVSGLNHCSIGICAEGDYDRETAMPSAQMAAIAELIRELRTRHPRAKVVGHREVGSSDCPGRYYPLNALKNEKINETEKEGLTMTQYEALKNEIEELTETMRVLAEELYDHKHPMIYNYIDENMPAWAREAVSWAVNQGIIRGDEHGLNLDDKDLRYIVMMYRIKQGGNDKC